MAKLGHIAGNLSTLRECLGDVDLVCVTKYASLEEIKAMYDAGERVFGESRVQDTIQKIQGLEQAYGDAMDLDSISWHLIGHLQGNKVKKAVGLYEVIQSVDSVKLAKAISEEAGKRGIAQKLMIQVNLANDGRKFGLSEAGFWESCDEIFSFSNLSVIGILLIAPHTGDDMLLKAFFEQGRIFFNSVQERFSGVKELSMGMSNDYAYAVDAGTTMVRIGSLITKE